jgi:hypothetical protein
VSVAIAILHTKRMCRDIMSPVACSAVPHFQPYLMTTRFSEKLFGRKVCELFSCVMVLHRTAVYCDGVTWHSCLDVCCYITQL